jgi:hypothetical protein
MTSHHCTPAGTEIAGGEMTLVAANGDEVYIEYAGFAPGPDPVTGIIYVEVDYVIVGGDGRFEGVHGGGEMTVDVVFEGMDDLEWAATWSWTGTIGY